MFCKNCGHEISDDAKFCSNCGTKVEVEEEIVVPVEVVDKTEETVVEEQSKVEINNEETVESTLAKEWYYVENNDSKGAFTLEEMKELIESNKITGSTLVWKASLKDWQKLTDSQLGQFMREDEEKNWYYVENNDSKGPYSQDEMKGFLDTGILTGNSFVWKTGMQDWTRLKDTELAGNEMPEPTPQPSYSSYYGVKEKSIALSVVLSFVTCGLYGLYWLYSIAKDLNDLSASQHQEKGPDPFLVVILSIVTCGIYLIYYMWKAGKMVSSLTKNGQHLSDDSIILMVLAILQLSLVSYCILQSNINGFTKN